MDGRCSTYSHRKFSKTRMVTSNYPPICGWKVALNRRCVPRMENNSVQNLLMNLGSRSEMITSGIPCSRNTLSNTHLFCAGYEVRHLCPSINKHNDVVLPSDSRKVASKSMVICCYGLSRIGIGYKTLAHIYSSELI